MKFKFYCAFAIFGIIWLQCGALGSQQAFGYKEMLTHKRECNMEVHLRLNDSFVVDNFPPPQGPSARYAYTPAPTECTLAFYGAEDCMLEFRTTHYKRGNIQCEEEYLLIGDEHEEIRVCGFGRPPKLLNSTGNALFLSHFGRNSGNERYGRSGVSGSLSIGGVALCRKREPISCPGQTHGCVSPAGLDCPANFTCSLTGSLRVDTRELTLLVSCRSGVNTSCIITAVLCTVKRPVNATCDDVPLPTLPRQPGTFSCTVVQGTCPSNNTDCSVSAETDIVVAPNNPEVKNQKLQKLQVAQEKDFVHSYQMQLCTSDMPV